MQFKVIFIQDQARFEKKENKTINTVSKYLKWEKHEKQKIIEYNVIWNRIHLCISSRENIAKEGKKD